ncbi:Tex family protein [Proteiniborus sp. MB09-C3]|uniref:Tex family protein n=1 Tax=Proteiniborus sp. MB09-C3 TaxID=3050072 RepID=UPI0025530D73|nr:Tex family protein [Proteiniborus sp. MB09-C3]WIV12009.1 Tex family protein [Proteiniborus sp. MB09-C3]
MNIISRLTEEFKLKKFQVENTVNLIDEGNTIPFIARYRKEQTGELSDVILRDLYERLIYLRNLEGRQNEVIRLIEEQGKLTAELKKEILSSETLQRIEDLYRPYKPKRRTRATIAKEKGLEPLAEIIMSQNINQGSLDEIAAPFIDAEKEVNTVEEAYQGAMDIIAEVVSDNAEFREIIRKIVFDKGIVITSASDDKADSVYEMYYDYKEPVKVIANHRILAINRGEKEKFLKVKIESPDDEIIDVLKSRVVNNDKAITTSYLISSIEDGYKRLISPSIEREIRNTLTEKAEEQAIKVFGVNLKPLLMQAPVKGKVVMGFDPAFRTGCKIAVVDETGKLLDFTTVYPTEPQNKVEEARKELINLINKYNVDIIAIGNGTASRESETIVAEMLRDLDRKVYYTIVSEAGASVYSASKVANEEYPDINVSIRGAISIGKRLQDPLAELVKIDPKSVGVGQYQHDINQGRLDETLKGVVEDCVNNVGVDLNTASISLLSYVSGVSSSVAKNIVGFREEKGKFNNRKELLKVKRLGEATFVQCAGFLRISDGDNPLDNTAVHPESYDVALALIEKLGFSTDDIKAGKLKQIDSIINEKNIIKFAEELQIGVPTLRDIIKELKKPARDPREEMPKPIFRTDVLKMEDLKPDMILTGTVRNVVDFGAFVDIGVKQDGLVHISHLSNKFVKNPMEVVSVGDIVNVKILDVDVEKGRISLSMKEV